MSASPSILVGKGASAQRLLLERANRHGLIAGATGTGKTVTLQILTEGFSAAGVPVFVTDVKGDLSGLSQPGNSGDPLHEKLQSRARAIGLDAKGVPGVTDRTLIRPPASRIGPASSAERTALRRAGPLAGRYEESVDRDSAFEKLAARAEAASREAEAAAERERIEKERRYRRPPAPRGRAPARRPSPRARQGSLETAAKSAARSMGSAIGRRLVRGLLGSLLMGR